MIPSISFNFQKVEEIPQICLSAAKILESQTLFRRVGSVFGTIKIISVESWDETRIIDIFNKNIRILIENKNAWDIHSFGYGNNQYYDDNHRRIPQGLSLRLYNHERCSLESLNTAYIQVWNSFCNGWKESKAEDYQDILFKKDPEKYVLLIKERSLAEEDTLIRFLNSKFKLRDQIDSNSTWNRDSSNKDKIYTWIDRNAFSSIVDKFGFKISSIHYDDLFGAIKDANRTS